MDNIRSGYNPRTDGVGCGCTDGAFGAKKGPNAQEMVLRDDWHANMETID
jgi:hypothetical protein